MSDTPLGPGWWQATDSRWYPPEQHPLYRPAPPAATVPPPKKRHWLRWLLGIIGLLIVLIIVIVAVAAGKVDHNAHVQHTVVYSVTGSSGASTITYETVQQGHGQNGESQVTGATLPWTKTITASGLFTDFTLSAQNSGGGSITCTISEDGKVLNTNTATGQFAIATCTATGTS